MTIENMLKMQTCYNMTTYNKTSTTENWVRSFFQTEPTHRPGTLFMYDTSSSHTLCALVEKLTGEKMLDYLKEKLLRQIGFSEESYIIEDPFGTSMGGSGLMATPEDLLRTGCMLLKQEKGSYAARATEPRTATQLLQPTVHLYYTNRTRLNSEEIGDRKMKREVDLNEISDGRLYSSGDMVKVDCHDCEGCSACCQGMGNSIILDPMDLWRLQLGKKENFDTLLANYLELNVVDGMVLPNLKMAGEEEACLFLKDGRCSIHGYRPGICRLFPLGRIYEENGFKYFIQVHECKKQERGKVKIKKWLGIADQKRYEDFVWRWHTFLKNCEEGMKELDEQNAKVLTVVVLRNFYQMPYQAEEEAQFYPEFEERLERLNAMFGF